MAMIYPFRNLIFQGGGVRAFAYQGALEVLEQRGILPNIQRVGGSSAGALVAMLLSFGLSAAETNRLFNTIDFKQVKSPAIESKVESAIPVQKLVEAQLSWLKGNVDAAWRLLSRYGWYPLDYSKTWVEGVVAQHCGGNGRATFAGFKARGYRDVYILATNLSKHRREVFSFETTPDVAVADAVVMSGLIPIFFEAVQFDGVSLGQGDYYIDGGAMDNFPIHLFDHPRFVENQTRYTYGVNWETLGCRLFSPENCPPFSPPITNFISYGQNFFEILMEAQQVIHDSNPVDLHRTISISNLGVSPVEFDIIPPKHPKYQALVASGCEAAEAYLAAYKLPTDRFYDVKLKYAEFLELLQQYDPRKIAPSIWSQTE